MKKFILLLCLLTSGIGFGQNHFNYRAHWQKIEKQEQEKGKLKSLLPAVETIYRHAKKDNRVQQTLKALFYRFKINLQTSDDDDISRQVIQTFKAEIQTDDGAKKALLQSMLAELYQSYYRYHARKIDQRTNTVQKEGEDFRYWPPKQFAQTVLRLYRSSVEEKSELQKEPIKKWSVLLKRKQKTEYLRPTLYDFLAHRYLDYLTQKSFRHSPTAREKTKAIALLEELTSFHRKKGNRAASLYNAVALATLKYKKNGAEKYARKLSSIAQQYKANNYTPYVFLKISNAYREAFARKKLPHQKRAQFAKKALAYSHRILKDFPQSQAVDKAKNIISVLTQPKFKLEIEGFLSPQQNIPVSISYKNLDHLYFRIYPYNRQTKKRLKQLHYADTSHKTAVLRKITETLSPIKSFDQSLRLFTDYQSRTTTGRIPPLDQGHYVVLVSNRPGFQIVDNDHQLFYKTIRVTPYVMSFRNKAILLTNRETGRPVAQKKIKVYRYRNHHKTKVATLKTNALGEAAFHHQNNHQFRFRVVDDSIFFTRYLYNRTHSKAQEIKKKTKIFTDRKIYRPGQRLYFKLIAYTTTPDHKRSVAAHQEITLTLNNPNRKKLAALHLKTNAFGSVSGEFVLPTSGLNGNYTLRSSFGNSSYSGQRYNFSVEDYKRPKFNVHFKAIDTTFALEKQVSTTGIAKAFSGASIGGAKVTYRVYRQAIYPYIPRWRSRFFPVPPKTEITRGTTQTDRKGRFTIRFMALPDSSDTLPKKEYNTYRYTLTAAVTDINGETRSAQQQINIGDLRYRLKLPISQEIKLADFDSIPIITENLNGKFVAAQGEISLTKLKAPKRVLRQSPLPKTDYERYSKEEFIRYFPHEPYGNEQEKKNWQPGKVVLHETFNTQKAKSIKVTPQQWPSGYYRLRAFIIDGQDTIPQEKLVYLYRTEEKKPVDGKLFSVHLNKNSYQPGDQAVVSFSSAAKQASVLVELEVDGKITKSKIIHFNNDVKTFHFPIKKAYRGNVFVHYYFGKFNRVTSGTLPIPVPYRDRSLKITTKTFRNKLKPGQKETWTLAISGQGKNKILAEMLATMYDASLDQFRSNSNSFAPGIPRHQNMLEDWDAGPSFRFTAFTDSAPFYYNGYTLSPNFDQLQWFGLKRAFLRGPHYGAWPRAPREPLSIRINTAYRGVTSDKPKKEETTQGLTTKKPESLAAKKEDTASKGAAEDQEKQAVVPRRNLQETAFFYPHLRTDKNGDIKIKFTAPESLTAWKFMATAHTKDMRTGYLQKTVVTQKKLMVTPNPPRFLREGDTLRFSTKIANLSNHDLTGKVTLQLFDAFTMQPVDKAFKHGVISKNFSLAKKGNTAISWRLYVPEGHQAVVYRITASTDRFSDGVEDALPILTNRKLVTETLPIFVREGQDKTFTLEKLKNTTSKSRTNFKLTFEMAKSPIWYAVFSLPSLREPTYHNSIADFAWLYGTLISEKIIQDNPKIKAVFKNWQKKGQLKSKLEQNQKLKELLLSQTPWVREAESEDEQMKRIARLFDQNTIEKEMQTAFNKLEDKQSSQGGFPWFDGGDDSPLITTYILAGFGHLKALGIPLKRFDDKTVSMIDRAISYLDRQAIARYRQKNQSKPDTYTGLYYLYARSQFLKSHPLPSKVLPFRDRLLHHLNAHKFDLSLPSQALAALVLERYGKHEEAVHLLQSIKDHAVNSPQRGMYWKANTAGWLWQQSPITTQALLITDFHSILHDTTSVENMKVWLLKQRHTNRWTSVKATTEAVYVLLNTGKDWLHTSGKVSVKIGGKKLAFKKAPQSVQTGTGYVKTSWHKSAIKPAMGTVEVTKNSPGISWGALYWQYFEDLDKISSAQTGIKIRKELFLKKNTANGPVLQPITPQTPIKVGDLVRVRLKIQTDRKMQFVHLKDMRASGFEPSNVISQYNYQDGLRYYESTHDAATHFFFTHMPKGTYVFSYTLRANNTGDFSNGITIMQNMYAPELSAHSKGIRVRIH